MVILESMCRCLAKRSQVQFEGIKCLPLRGRRLSVPTKRNSLKSSDRCDGRAASSQHTLWILSVSESAKLKVENKQNRPNKTERRTWLWLTHEYEHLCYWSRLHLQPDKLQHVACRWRGHDESEISTCMLLYPSSCSDMENVLWHVAGQSRDAAFSAMCLCAVKNLPFNIIDHKSMSSGLSQMECDSVHADTEPSRKNVPVYSPEGHHTLVKTTRKSMQCEVTELSQ